MIVAFATTCDFVDSANLRCGRRSVEYTTWPTCRVCFGDFCPAHSFDMIEAEGRTTCLCVDCLLKGEFDVSNS